MSYDDGIDSYRGREAEWAALCALDCIESSSEPIKLEDAHLWIDSVWEFVLQNCEDFGRKVPSKSQAIAKLKILLKNR